MDIKILHITSLIMFHFECHVCGEDQLLVFDPYGNIALWDPN